MKTPALLLALFILAAPAARASACDAKAAASLVNEKLLSTVNPNNGCLVKGVGAEKKSWWGYRYFPVSVICQNDDSIKSKTVFIFINERTSACEFGF